MLQGRIRIGRIILYKSTRGLKLCWDVAVGGLMDKIDMNQEDFIAVDLQVAINRLRPHYLLGAPLPQRGRKKF